MQHARPNRTRTPAALAAGILMAVVACGEPSGPTGTLNTTEQEDIWFELVGATHIALGSQDPGAVSTVNTCGFDEGSVAISGTVIDDPNSIFEGYNVTAVATDCVVSVDNDGDSLLELDITLNGTLTITKDVGISAPILASGSLTWKTDDGRNGTCSITNPPDGGTRGGCQ
ncbi:MAG TPA: hypothetical protein VGA37_14245 [Gemmatimonadales bacterium]